MLHVGGALVDVPVEPDSATARQWLRDELAKAVYHQQPSLLERLWTWATEQFQRFLEAASGVDGRSSLLIVVGAIVVIAVIALLVAGPVQRSRAAARASTEVFGDDTRSTAQLLAAAEQHAAAGRFGPAVLDRFRALLRSLEDRTVLDPRPGRTADEGAREAGDRLPGCAVELLAAARLFDDVCYGDAEADAEDDRWLATVLAQVAATRPAALADGPQDAPAAEVLR
ncbi:DUF4129 domain-containing protein [Actinotalea sp.]|uniref:DUF4129 domain-containing protein n=1 Tax=Actinotalea sp. TaxID=1872145 RepID=UPI0035614FB8